MISVKLISLMKCFSLNNVVSFKSATSKFFHCLNEKSMNAKQRSSDYDFLSSLLKRLKEFIVSSQINDLVASHLLVIYLYFPTLFLETLKFSVYICS